MKTIAFLSNQGGVGTTSLVYHLAWMYADLGLNVLVADLDPQANLTSMFVDEGRLATLLPEAAHHQTIFGSIRPLLASRSSDGTGDISPPHVEDVVDNIGLLVGDLAMSAYEDELHNQWHNCLDRQPRAFAVLSAFWQVMEQAAAAREATLVLVDVGPHLGAISRAALIASQQVVFPLAPDRYSVRGLKNLGPLLRRWRAEWAERRRGSPGGALSIPPGEMTPAGYVLLQPTIRFDRPVQDYDWWMSRIPGAYQESVLGESNGVPPPIGEDPHCLALLKPYRSLLPLAREARKPMFFLKAADGASGGHVQAVQDCYRGFRILAHHVADHCGVPLPVWA